MIFVLPILFSLSYSFADIAKMHLTDCVIVQNDLYNIHGLRTIQVEFFVFTIQLNVYFSV